MITPKNIDQIVVINDFTRPVGGAGKLAMESVAQYRARGFPVTVLTGQGETEALTSIGAIVHGLDSEGLLKVGKFEALRHGYHNPHAADLIGNWIATHDTPRAVYHVNNWSQILSPSIFKPLQNVASRAIVSCHDFFNVCPNGGFVHFGKGIECHKTPLSLACLVSQCDRRSPLHKYWRIARQRHFNALAKLESTPFTFTSIHHIARQKFIDAGFKAKDLRTVVNPAEPWSSSRITAEDNRHLLFVGRVGPDKGADIALEAAHRAGMPLMIAGTGPDDDALRSEYPEAHFAGWCDQKKLLELARKARAVIVPSRVVEPFGLVILEAAMSGLPVLISKQGFLGADIEHIGAGAIIDVSDMDSIVAKLHEIMQSDTQISNMSRAGYERAPGLCNSYESWVDAFLDIFEEKLTQVPG